MRRSPKSHHHHYRREERPSPPDDPFDYWLHLVVEIIVQPALDLLNIVWGMIRGVLVKPRPRNGRRGSGNRHRRHREGGRT